MEPVRPPGRVVAATGNPAKLRELREILSGVGVEIVGLGGFPPVVEPEETGETFAGNARAKALYYARKTGQWCLADDSGLEVDALDAAPGVRSARYACERVGENAAREQLTAANNAKLLEALADVPDEDRAARFVCHLALADPEAVRLEARGTLEGRIARVPAGAEGFGYDPVFYLPDRGCTAAELTAEQKNAISHRGAAARALAEKLRRSP